MSTFPRNLRLPLLTALVMLASSWAGIGGEASACSSMKANASCAKPCGCCKPKVEPAPARSVETTVEAEAVAPPAIPSPLVECGALPGGPCACRAEGPSAPAEERQSQPRPSRSERQDRSPSPTVVDMILRGDAAAMPSGRPGWRSASSRQHVPIYLRDARLLF